MTFSSAVIADAQSIAKLVNSAYRGDYSKQGWTTEADILGGQRTDSGKIQEMIEDPQATIELLKVGNQLMGCVYLKHEGDAVYLGMLTVEPTQQDKKYGSQLMTHAESWAQQRGVKKMKMTVIEGRDTLIAYYQRRGWYFTGKTEPFPMNDPRFGLPKTQLTFLEMIKDI